eukprot:jgi/Chlat1/4625/Chrsp3S05588
MASVDDLRDALREALERRGVLGQLRAKIRAEATAALAPDSHHQQLQQEGSTRRGLSNENLIINELIREYLAYNRYRETLSVFLPESGQPEDPPFDRRFLARTIHASDYCNDEGDGLDSQTPLPLLYSLLADTAQDLHKGTLLETG